MPCLFHHQSSFLLTTWKESNRNGLSAWTLVPKWEIQKELPPPGFSVVQPWPLQPSRERTNKMTISVSLFLFHSLPLSNSDFQVNKSFFFNVMHSYKNFTLQCICFYFIFHKPIEVLLYFIVRNFKQVNKR